MDNWYCSEVCKHDAGDRTCGEDCGCSGYAKKRRLLRAHRDQMRIIDDLIKEQGLEEELEDRIFYETDNTSYWLGHSESMDEDSDQEDPEAALRQELADKSAFVEAATGALQYNRVATDLERARMEMEDMRSHMCK